MPLIFRRKKKRTEPTVTHPSLEEAYKAEVRLKLLMSRLASLMALEEPVSLKDVLDKDGQNKKKVDEALASQLFKSEFGSTIGHRLGDKVKVTDSANEAWRRLLLRLKIAERKYGFNHPWTQLVFEVCCNIAKKRAYYSIREEDTKVEVATLPLEMFLGQQWKRRTSSLS